jgi:hypothetical protein
LRLPRYGDPSPIGTSQARRARIRDDAALAADGEAYAFQPGVFRNLHLRQPGLALPRFVPSESLDSDNHVIPGACFAGQPGVSVEPASERPDYRSHRRSVTAEVAYRAQLWESSCDARSHVVSERHDWRISLM